MMILRYIFLNQGVLGSLGRSPGPSQASKPEKASGTLARKKTISTRSGFFTLVPQYPTLKLSGCLEFSSNLEVCLFISLAYWGTKSPQHRYLR